MNLKEKLKTRQLTIGSWITIGNQSIAEIMASGGFEWLTIDMEHSVIGLKTAQNLIGHIQSQSLKALVRVGKNEEVVIKRVMDAGADGIFVPMINSKKDAERAVSYVKYPPKGKRGVGLARAQKYGACFDEYKKWVDSESIVIAHIEHIKAVEKIESIVKTEGIDGFFIGPYDLSGSMGIPGEFESAEFLSAVKEIELACQKFEKSLGIHVVPTDTSILKEKIKAGYNLLAFSTDFLFLRTKIIESSIKEILQTKI
jgi:2-dehydro-3-deoxyglucarate aldolase